MKSNVKTFSPAGIQDQPSHQVTLPNGVVLNYVRQGAGPVVFLIHGAMGDLRSWEPQWNSFTVHFDCISYSRRYSYPNPNALTTRSHNAMVDAEDLFGLMDCLSIESAILVGSSYGGFTALAAANISPQRVRAVVAVEPPMMRYAEMTADGAQVAQAFRESAILPARAAFERGDDMEGTRILTGGIIGRKPDAIPAAIMERRMQNAQAARSLSLSDDEFPLIEPSELSALQMPILLMSGANTAPVHAAIFKNVSASIPKARIRIIKDSGHSVSQQQPTVFNAEVFEFLASSGCLKNLEPA
ncbi:MAG: alpha/beta hydrolase [Ahrensia sp.]|nr:alpha/beta hydrolase [Ahrensia sp.]